MNISLTKHITLFLLSCTLTFVVKGQPLFISSPVHDGNSSTYSPFTIEEVGVSSMRWQQVYNASEFSQIAGSGGYITHIYFRYGAGYPTVKVITNAQLNLSTTAKQADRLSQSFAENLGLDDTIVFGPASLTINLRFGFDTTIIPLTRPFFYSPENGNLLLDVRNFTGASREIIQPPNQPAALDAENTFGDGVSSVFSLSVESPIATISTTLGLVTGFGITPVPEPSSLSVLVFGLALFCYLLRRIRQPRCVN